MAPHRKPLDFGHAFYHLGAGTDLVASGCLLLVAALADPCGKGGGIMQPLHEQVLTFAAAVDRLIALKAQAALSLEEHNLVAHCIAELEEIFLVPETQESPLPWLRQ